ncbi:MAG: flagellar hook-length control protein FliK [Janthinobacterium lividum]
MPPDMTAGPMSLVGTPPGATVSVKPASGPPGLETLPAETLSVSLFASLLAQNTEPTTTLAAKASPLKAAITKGPASLPVSQSLDALPVLTPPLGRTSAPKQTSDPKQLSVVKPIKSGSLKTMDTAPKLSTLPTEKVEDKASELPLHKALADLPDASSQISTQAPTVLALPSVPVAVVPFLIPISTSVPVSTTLAAPTVTALVSAQIVPSVSEAVVTSQGIGLALPRTFALTASVPDSQAASAPSLPTIAIQARQSPVPLTAKLSTVSSDDKSVLQNTASASSLTPAAAPAIQPSATALTGAIDTPAVVVAALSSIQPALSNSSPAAQTSITGKVDGKSVENALKSPNENADINTRQFAASLPSGPAKVSVSSAAVGAVSSKSEKHDEAQADPSTLGANTLLGAQVSAKVVEASLPDSKPLSAAEQADLAQQTANGVAAMPMPTKPGAAEQMSLQLHPKDWGQLQVSVSIVPGTEAGSAKTVTAHIVAETPQIKAALESQTGTLHQALTASGLHLEHLTVSVKAPEAKAAEVTSASQSASAGQSSNQGQPNTNSQAGTSMGGGQTQASQTSSSSTGSTGSGAFASFAGSFQDGRQGQQQRAFSAAVEPEQEEMTRSYTPQSPAWGRIDTHA